MKRAQLDNNSDIDDEPVSTENGRKQKKERILPEKRKCADKEHKRRNRRVF